MNSIFTTPTCQAANTKLRAVFCCDHPLFCHGRVPNGFPFLPLFQHCLPCWLTNVRRVNALSPFNLTQSKFPGCCSAWGKLDLFPSKPKMLSCQLLQLCSFHSNATLNLAKVSRKIHPSHFVCLRPSCLVFKISQTHLFPKRQHRAVWISGVQTPKCLFKGAACKFLFLHRNNPVMLITWRKNISASTSHIFSFQKNGMLKVLLMIIMSNPTSLATNSNTDCPTMRPTLLIMRNLALIPRTR